MKCYINRENGFVPYSQADPYILKANGCYYVYATHSKGVQLYKSKDLKSWDYLGLCFSKEDEKQYWAPSVIEFNGKFYMYVSTMKNESDDVHTQAIRVIESDNPETGWKFVKEILPPFSIDAHVVEFKGSLYIFYCNNDYESQRAGTYILVDKMVDPYTVEGNPVPVVKPTLDEEIYEKNRFKVGQHWHTIEGAFYLNKGDEHYVMYSGSAYEKETYFIGYSFARGDVDDLRKLDFKKMPADDVYAPVICKNDFLEGSGHNSVLEEDGKYYIVYHARDIGDAIEGEDRRTFRIDDLIVEDGKMIAKIVK